MEERSSKKISQNNTSFKFVTYQVPGDARNTKTRTQVRSHVSRWQHKKTRDRLYNAAKPGSGASSSTDTPITEAATTPKQVAVTQNNFPREDIEPDDEHLVSSTKGTTSTRSRSIQPAPSAIALSKPFSQGTMSFRTIALQDSENVVGESLNELQLELPSVMRLYKSMSERQSLDFIRQYGEGSGFRFVPLVFTDPVLLASAVLIGVRNHLDVQGRCIQGKTLAGVLNIEQFITRSINNALADPIRGITDQMLLAVALCASYEIKHGNAACFHMHMRGLMQMINLRGGLLAIGDPDPYVLRVLFWLDINSTKLAGCKPYFEEMAGGFQVRLLADPKMFQDKGLED